MNLIKLFEMQKALDTKIIREKGLEGQDLLPKKILALQVELGELANEWRGFKFWSKDQSPRTFKLRESLKVDSGGETYIGHDDFNPLLEEYVDCLHFILSIGWDIGVNPSEVELVYSICEEESTTDVFRVCFMCTVDEIENDNPDYWFGRIWTAFDYLGKELGFTWEQIAAGYLAKNQVNHERQVNGY